MSTPIPPFWLQLASEKHVSDAAETTRCARLAVEEVGKVVGLGRDHEGDERGERDSGDTGVHGAD
jgi:hypothetical protein